MAKKTTRQNHQTNGAFIKQIRVKAGSTQEVVARKWGISERTLSDLENGHGGSPETLMLVASKAGIANWHELLSDAEKLKLGIGVPEVVKAEPKPTVTREDLKDYLKQIQNAHGKIKFLGLPKLKESPTKEGQADTDIADLFVEPALAEQFISPDTDPKEWKGHTSLLETVTKQNRLVILGDPGSGKSTLVNWISWNLAHPCVNSWRSALEDRIPLPFVLRDLGLSREITWDQLVEKFLEHSAHRLMTRQQFDELVNSGRAVILLDGLDEIGDIKTREKLRSVVWSKMQAGKQCGWIVTTRIAGYSEVMFHLDESRRKYGIGGQPLEYASLFHVVPFDNPRIKEFAKKWYAIRESDKYKAEREADNLVKAIHRDKDTVRLARIPNLLTIMSLVYRIESDLPHGKANLYDKIATAYLETIDKYYRLPTGEDSTNDKKSWLGQLAFRMQRNRVAAESKEQRESAVVADGDTLRGWLKTAMPRAKNDPDAPAKFLDQVKLRSGLIIERAPDRFAFTHLSFQEFFAAVYLREWVTSDEWLESEGLPEGTTAADLFQYGQSVDWREVLVFLFELLAELKPARKKKVRDAVWGKNWESLDGAKHDTPAAVLLARLAVDPQAGWDDETREIAIQQALAWVVRILKTEVLFDGAMYAVVLRHCFEDVTRFDHRMRALIEIVMQQQTSKLDLGDIRIVDVTPLAQLTQLQHLWLHNTGVVDVTPLAQLTQLHKLWLENTGVVDVTPLAQLKQLQTLSLNNTGVADVTPLAKLTQLQTLLLHNTGVVDVTPLAKLTQLQVLYLNNTGVVDVTPLAKLTQLRSLYLRNTGVPEKQVAELQAKLPQCRIYHSFRPD